MREVSVSAWGFLGQWRLPVPPVGMAPRSGCPRVGQEGEGRGVAGGNLWGNPGGWGEGCPRGVPPPWEMSRPQAGRLFWGVSRPSGRP